MYISVYVDIYFIYVRARARAYDGVCNKCMRIAQYYCK